MYIDIYVLAPNRTRETIDKFMRKFSPNKEPNAEDYPVPQFSDGPQFVLKTAEEVIAHCCAHPEVSYDLTFRNVDAGDPHIVGVYFLSDGSLVLGVSVASDCQAEWDRWLEEMKAVTGAEHGYWITEEIPEDTAELVILRSNQMDELRRSRFA